MMRGMSGGPAEMFKAMAGEALNTDKLATYATPELRALFEDWLVQLEDEIIAYANDRDTVRPEDVATEFKVSMESAVFLLGKLAQNDKIKIDGISANAKGRSCGNDEEPHDGQDQGPAR